MTVTTGLIALALLFVSGPYIFLEKRWPRVWRPLPIWAHANVSLATAAVVLIHLILSSNKFGYGPTWWATGLFGVVTVSGLYGLHVATSGPAKQRWLRFQRWLAYAFYAAIVFHIVTKTVGFPLIPAVAGGWAMWHWRAQIRRWLIRSRWPYSRNNSARRPYVAAWRLFAAWQAVATVAMIGGTVGGLVAVSSGDRHQAVGHVVEVEGGDFTLEVGDKFFRVTTTAQTKFEDIDGDLAFIMGENVRVKVQWDTIRRGAIIAREIEARPLQTSDS